MEEQSNKVIINITDSQTTVHPKLIGRDIKEIYFNFKTTDRSFNDIVDYLHNHRTLTGITYTYSFSDLNFNTTYEDTIIRVRINEGNKYVISFNVLSIKGFCGGFQLSDLGRVSTKEYYDEIDFIIKFIFCKFFGKRYGEKYMDYPIIFFDRTAGQIVRTLNPKKILNLNTYINPNTNNEVGIYKYTL